MSESDFPPEILFDILSRLPPKDLIRILCVSKSWYAIIHDHHFIKAHLQRSIQTNSARTLLLRSNSALWSDFYSLSFNGDEAFGTLVPIERPLKCPGDYLEMLGCSVNGVVCIHDCECTDVCLWNTSIQKLKKIPLPTLEHQPPSYSNRYTLFGFGYDSANDDFKVLRITQFENRKRESVDSQVGVYSLKSNSWKKIQSLPCHGFSVHRREIVFTNGALCWLMRKDNSRCIILTLDLANENYREFHTPVDEDDNSLMNLVVLRGSLCVFVNNRSSRHEVWIMHEYGTSDSWTLLYSIGVETGPETVPWWFDHCEPLGFSKNGEMVLLKKGEGALVWFDLEQKNSNQVYSGGLPRLFKATICLGTLSLLDGDSVVSEEGGFN
ncbi:hypothetical protein FF2_022036 [Malus domestica]